MTAEVVMIVEHEDMAVCVSPVTKEPGRRESGNTATDNHQVVNRAGLFRGRSEALAMPGKCMRDLE